MCNRYSQTGSISQIRKLADELERAIHTTPGTDNLPSQDNVYPDQDAPIVINEAKGGLELIMARWGFPPIPGEKSPITNIRNLKSKWWSQANREWIMNPEYRCLVPFTEFAEPVRDSTWFKVPNVEIAYFAGVWRPWEGERLVEQDGQKRRVRQNRNWKLYSFLTTDANDVVKPIHPTAMPVILVNSTEQKEWLKGGEQSLHLQRSLPNKQLQINMREM